MGFLTRSPGRSDHLVCPSRLVRELFFKHWFWRISGLERKVAFPAEDRRDVVDALAMGDIRPLLECVARTLGQSGGKGVHSPLSETAFKFATAMAVSTSEGSRAEGLSDGGAGLVLRLADGGAPGWLIELRHLGEAGADRKAVDGKLSEAEAALARRSQAEPGRAVPNLRRAAAVFGGTELLGVKVF